MSPWLQHWNGGGGTAGLALRQCRLRAVRVVPTSDPPLPVCPNQRTYCDTVEVENEPRGARISKARPRRSYSGQLSMA